MSPTGSTSEQKSPTKWQVRLGLAFVVCLLLVMATTASAGGGNGSFQAQNTTQPERPAILPSTNIAVPAGSGPLILTADAGSPSGIPDYSWTPLSSDAGSLTFLDERRAQARFSPPRTVCNSLGETHLYRVRATIQHDGGVSSPPTDVTIQVLPWGAPDAPFDGGQEVTLVAGDSVTGSAELRPTATHACDGRDPDFQGVDTVWKLVDAGPVPPGVSLVDSDGGLISGSSAVTPVLRIETQECTRAEFHLTAQNYTRSGFGGRGPESNVHVTVKPDLNPLSEATLQLTRVPATSEAVAGSASVGGLRCPNQRGDLRLQARIFLTSDDVIVREGIFPVPGSWQFMLGDVCLGTTYELQGELLVDGGVAGGAVPGGAIDVPAADVTLRPMVAPSLMARCGQPAMGVLEQRLLYPCSEQPISWEPVGEIALTQPSYTGHRIEVATQDTDFGELIGQSVVMRMRAMARQESILVQEVPILTEPFVELHRHTERATGSAVDLVGVSVELHNTTQCGVRQVDHIERLEAADYVPGSARFNGSPVEAEIEGDTLTVRGLELEANTTGRLTYVARPRLVESARFDGQTFVRGVPVSRPLDDPSFGCGCSGAGSGLAALGLAGLTLVLRRRRGR